MSVLVPGRAFIDVPPRSPVARPIPAVVAPRTIWPNLRLFPLLGLVLLGLAMMLLPILLPFVAGRRLFARSGKIVRGA